MSNYKSSAKANTKTAKKVNNDNIITDVRIFPVDDGNGILASVSVTFCDVFVVTGLKIIDGKKGAFVSMPQYKYKGEWKDSCFPITADFREALTEIVLDAYENQDE